MNEEPDALERELGSLKPHEASSELRQHVSERLADPPSIRSAKRWTLAPAAIVIVISALVAIAILPPKESPREAEVIVPTPGARLGSQGGSFPTVWTYRQALDRSPEEFDNLLQQHSALVLTSDPKLTQLSASMRPDVNTPHSPGGF